MAIFADRRVLPESVDELETVARTIPPEGVDAIAIENGIIVIEYPTRGSLPGGTIELSP